MKKHLLLAAVAAFVLTFNVNAQNDEKTDDEGYKFTVQKELKVTSVKNQKPVPAGAIPVWASLRQNCSAWEKVSMICQRCSL